MANCSANHYIFEGFKIFPPADATDREQENQSTAQPDREKA
jgi:hypothetical protein